MAKRKNCYLYHIKRIGYKSVLKSELSKNKFGQKKCLVGISSQDESKKTQFINNFYFKRIDTSLILNLNCQTQIPSKKQPQRTLERG
jgi:hypothetical protein